MNSPVTSPSDVPTSSPIITVNGAISRTWNAPSAVLWSVTAMQFSPTSRQRATSFSGGRSESGE